DGDGGSTVQNKVVNVNNVAPTASVTGADAVSEGSVYALSVGAVSDPGTDTRTAYSINWGDGNTDTLTAAQWTAAAGNFTHSYADGGPGGTARTITVSATDEDGTFTLGSKSLTVNNVAPSLTLSGNASSNEGASYTLNLVASDPAGGNDPLSYSINWGDGSAVENLTAAQLAAVSGNVTHAFADDEDGAVNSTARTIVVTANDGDGGSTVQNKVVNVNNVAPIISATGASSTTTGVPYSLTLSNYVDPGTDTLLSNGISVDWGDGTMTTHSAPGVVTHIYTVAGAPTIRVSLADEDGFYANVASVPVTVVQAGGGNNPPVADDETYDMRSNGVLNIAAPGVLAGDTDADGDTVVATSITDNVDHGAVFLFPDGHFTYTPDVDFVGVDHFTYRVSDGHGGTDDAVVTINVLNTNPVADD
ncbi:MAG: cadherin-like domain-containing protein, partial [Candidatus Accumulibacter sp.]|nr:cadherin-like domain-containing protein [Accumulibacter sp.]